MGIAIDKEKFIEIIKSNKGILYKIINSYCRDIIDRKDLEQEILIQIWKSLKNYNGDVKISTWIFKVATNVAISFYRTGIKHKNATTLYENYVFQFTEIEIENNLLETNSELLYKTINLLDEFNKAIIILYLEEYNYKEIAEIIGITETNVATKINRIKKILKENLS